MTKKKIETESESINELQHILKAVQDIIDETDHWAYQWCDKELFLHYVGYSLEDNLSKKDAKKCDNFFLNHFDEICLIIDMLTGISVNEIDGSKYFLFGNCTEEQVIDELKEMEAY